MIARATGLVLAGVDGLPVGVEAEVASGLPAVGLVGLADTAAGEARWRVRSAVASAGFAWPAQRLTINLTPADVRKVGTGLDLPIALAVLAASEQLDPIALAGTGFVGELGLDGALHSARASLALAVAAQRHGLIRLVLPEAAARQAARVPGLTVVPVRSLAEAVAAARGEGVAPASPLEAPAPAGNDPAVDLADVRGQEFARLALEVAAAGGHHLALTGPPGVGKTLLAEALPGILPPLTDDEAVEVAAIHSVAGLDRARWEEPPLRAPHHSVSTAALLGSVRRGAVVPGEVTLAHRGVLVLDEAAEVARPSLEGLRLPLEAGRIALHRAGWAGTLPAAFQLVLAANPCPCGASPRCTCPSVAVRRYQGRLSGPLVDRIDLRVAVSRPAPAVLGSEHLEEASATVRERVCAARQRSRARGAGRNGALSGRALRRMEPPEPAGADLLRAAERTGLSPRGVDRVLRVAWTLTDLAGRPRPGADEVALALALRAPETRAP